MKRHTITGLKAVPRKTIDTMEVGQLAVVEDAPHHGYVGHVIARVFSFKEPLFVSITDPAATWSGTPAFEVRILEPGEEFKVTVGK